MIVVDEPTKQAPIPPTPPPHSHPLTRQSLASELLARLPVIPMFIQPLMSRVRPPQSNVPFNLHSYLKNLENIYDDPTQNLKETKKFLSILNQELDDHLAIYEQTTKDLLHEIVHEREKSLNMEIFRTQKNSLTKENENLKETQSSLEQENKTLSEELKKSRQRILSLEENKSLLSVECAKIKQEVTILQIKLAENGSKEELLYTRERLAAEHELNLKLQQQIDFTSKNNNTLEDQKESIKLLHLKELNEVKRLTGSLNKVEQERNDLEKQLNEIQDKLKKETQESSKLKEDIFNLHMKSISSITSDYKGASYAQDKTFFEEKIISLQSDLEKARSSIRALEDEVDSVRKQKEDALNTSGILRGSNRELRDFLEKLTEERVRHETTVNIPVSSPKVIGFKNLIASEAARFNRLLNPMFEGDGLEGGAGGVVGSGKRIQYGLEGDAGGVVGSGKRIQYGLEGDVGGVGSGKRIQYGLEGDAGGVVGSGKRIQYGLDGDAGGVVGSGKRIQHLGISESPLKRLKVDE